MARLICYVEVCKIDNNINMIPDDNFYNEYNIDEFKYNNKINVATFKFGNNVEFEAYYLTLKNNRGVYGKVYDIDSNFIGTINNGILNNNIMNMRFIFKKFMEEGKKYGKLFVFDNTVEVTSMFIHNFIGKKVKNAVILFLDDDDKITYVTKLDNNDYEVVTC